VLLLPLDPCALPGFEELSCWADPLARMLSDGRHPAKIGGSPVSWCCGSHPGRLDACMTQWAASMRVPR